MGNHNYNAHHSPIGTFASLTLGFRGAQGGLGLELGGPANHNVYIGVEDQQRTFQCLPFFGDATAGAEEALRYDVEGSQSSDDPLSGAYVGHTEDAPSLPPARLRALDQSAISRDFQLSTDTWT